MHRKGRSHAYWVSDFQTSLTERLQVIDRKVGHTLSGLGGNHAEGMLANENGEFLGIWNQKALMKQLTE